MDFDADQRLKELTKDKPLGILLDSADRAVLRIADVKLFMDQILTTDNDEADDEFGSKCSSLVDSSETNFLERLSSTTVDDSIGCESNNEQNESPKKPSGSFLEIENDVGADENDVSSTSCAELEAVPNERDTNETVPNNEESNEVVPEEGGSNEIVPNEGDSNEVGSNVRGDSNEVVPSEGGNSNEAVPSEGGNSNEAVPSEGGDSNEVVLSSGDSNEVVPSSGESSLLVENDDSARDAENAAEQSENLGSTEAVSELPVVDDTDVDTEMRKNVIALPFASDTASASTLPSAIASTNGDSSLELSDGPSDLSKVNENDCDTRDDDANLVNDVISISDDERSNFLPTIVAIRGGCTDVLERTFDRSSSNTLHDEGSSSVAPQIPSLNIVNVLGGCRNLSSDKISTNGVGTESSNQVVLEISDGEETDAMFSNHSMNGDTIVIKEEPPDADQDNDCVYMGTEYSSTSLTSDFSITKKTSNNEGEDSDVIYIETTSKIPLPIPIKMESIIEAESQKSPLKTEKFTAKKRLTRSSVARSADECIVLSSSSDMECVSDSRKRTRVPKMSPAYSTPGYTCHLCNTVFQEHELLNEHMILHRNNSLIEAKVQNRSKTLKLSKPSYSCDICKKQLSTSQSLQQHVLIHRNEKPYGCHICHKDFRHLSNYRMHLQKHKAEQRRRSKLQQKSPEALDKSVVRGVDFGRLVGPLFMKESLLHQENEAKKQPVVAATKKPLFKQEARPRLSFDQSPFKATVRRDPSPDTSSDEECVAVKSFSNIESVVMNASKIIVKLDNLDTSVLKRKLQTPDISIDQTPKKCKVMLSPIAEKCNVKLDEIENIPMEEESPACVAAVEEAPACPPLTPLHKSHTPLDKSHTPLTDNELFELLNDDREPSPVASAGASPPPEPPKVASPPAKRSNVIFVETPDSCETSDADEKLDDAFDAAFQKVAARRLALLRKRAAQNGGKVPSGYLLGPLFWRKALRRAQMRVEATEHSPPKTWAARYGGRSRFDDRRTNDPTKLQWRAECKFKCLLDRAKMLNNLNSLCLIGPLFWQRTLQLAGVHRGEDLRTHMRTGCNGLDGVEFVDAEGKACEFADRVPAIRSDDRPIEPPDDATEAAKQDSILYESLTKPKECAKPAPPEAVDSASLAGNENSEVSHSREAENDRLKHNDSTAGDEPVDSAAVSIDGASGLQLIPASGDQVAEGGQNFLLVSDGSGGMQYMVNMPAENFANFDLMADGGAGEQVTYAIQFDGENYTAVQFVQDDGIELQGDGLKEAKDAKAASFLNAATDPGHIGKELSDFLNLDYRKTG